MRASSELIIRGNEGKRYPLQQGTTNPQTNSPSCCCKVESRSGHLSFTRVVDLLDPRNVGLVYYCAYYLLAGWMGTGGHTPCLRPEMGTFAALRVSPLLSGLHEKILLVRPQSVKHGQRLA
jgi:hypothetical protein